MFVVLILVGLAVGVTCQIHGHGGHTINCNSIHCSTHGHQQPVCGSDGHTYTNACTLHKAACFMAQKGRKLTQSHVGQCARATTHPPPTHCNLICDEETNHPVPICASSGTTYDSLCDFQNAQCYAAKKHHRLSLVHQGECQDLDSDCSEFANHHNCPDYHSYVCGSDGTTYVNNCTLRMSECRLQVKTPGSTITPVHEGRCHDGSTADARQIDCSQYKVDVTGIAVEGGDPSRFEISCNSTRSLICGTDGVSYLNDCYLCKHEYRLHHLDATMMTFTAHDGACTHHPVIG